MTELEAWLRLWHTPRVGPRTFNFLHSKFPDICQLLSTSHTELVNRGVPSHIAEAVTQYQSQRYLDDIAWLESHNSHSITLINQDSYPQLLKHISDPPPILYCVGDNTLLSAPLLLAIVGSRSASTFGKKIAREIAHELSDLGVVVLSGLARGIDGQAHEGALSSNTKATIAVLANGLDRTYPPEHKQLAKRIANDGLLVTEFPPGVKPLAQHFPRRNRIISGLSLGTLVIEAANKSGSLITAKYAMEQGREVFSVPGPINNIQNKGCHELIQQGAKLTTGIEDILTELAPMMDLHLDQTQSDCTNNHHGLNAELTCLLSCIEFLPTSIEMIIEKSGLTPERVSSMLTELELGGYVATDAFGQYCRI